jgi:hypothetical protein
MSWGSVFGIVIRVRCGQPPVRIPAEARHFFKVINNHQSQLSYLYITYGLKHKFLSSPKSLDQLWGPPIEQMGNVFNLGVNAARA